MRTGSPTIDINLTVDGKSRILTHVIDGFIEPEPPECPETALYFGAEASRSDLRLEEDETFPIVMRHHEASIGFTLAVKTPPGPGSGPPDPARREPDENSQIEFSSRAAPERRLRVAGSDPEDLADRALAPRGHGDHGFCVGGQVGEIAHDEAGSAQRRREVVDEEVPSDGDGNGRISILDAILALPVGRRLPSAVDCDDAFDADDNGRQTIRDVIVIIQYVFQGGRAFPQPFPACGPDPTNDPRECAAFTCP